MKRKPLYFFKSICIIFIILILSLIVSKKNFGITVKGKMNFLGISAYKDSFFSVSMPTEKFACIVGADGNILTTKDGSNWERKTLGENDLFSCCFVNGREGWITGSEGIIFYTNDGGETYKEQMSGTNNYLFSVNFIDSKHGWVTGYRNNEGILLHTENGGEKWEIAYRMEDVIPYDVYFFDKRKGFIVGERGLILVSQDGGNHWERVKINIDKTLFKVCFFKDKQHGFIVGMDGLILETKDGGKQWIATPSNTDSHLYGISIRNDNIFITGAKGIMLYAANHDFEFYKVPLKSKFWLLSIDGVGNKYYAVGSHGNIFKVEVKDKKKIDWEMLGGVPVL